MSKIEKLESSKNIDYSDNKIDYFIKESSGNDLVSYEDIIVRIHNATKIQLASTSVVTDAIIDAIYQNKDIHLYIILKSFEKSKSTLERFGQKYPAILREVNKLNNDFIIIDDISYIFINSLDNKQNITISFDEKQTQDLSYIFNYYFWECAKQEKIIDNINIPIESPFPALGKRELGFVNIIDEEVYEYINIFVPRDKKYESLLECDIKNRYFSDDIKSPIYNIGKQFQVGNIRFEDQNFEIENRYILKNDSLEDISISNNIIPKENNWNNEINILETKTIQIGDIRSKTIENMKQTKPQKFEEEKYVKYINYIWNVLPPLKPNDAKQSSLYGEFSKLNNSFQEQLNYLQMVLDDLQKESGLLPKWFSGVQRQATKNIKLIEEYRQKKLEKLSYIDLEEFIHNKFKIFHEEIVKSNKTFKEDKKKKESQEKWENQKLQKIKTLEKNKNNLLKDKEELTQLDSKSKEKSKLEKTIKDLEHTIVSLSKDIEENYTKFIYNPKINEIKNFNKNKTTKNEYKVLKLPKYILPEVGVLYENNKSYFVQIENYKDLKKANELSKRYIDKDSYKVVVGDNNE